MSRDNLSTLRFALEILRRIPRRRRITAAELQTQLAAIGIVRDLRSFRRMLTHLCDSMDIERDDAKPIGYRWKEGARGLSLAPMGEHEALLLLLAREFLAELVPPSMMRSMDPFFQQARLNLDPGGNAKLPRQWLSKVCVVGESVKLMTPKFGSGVLEAVSQALYANRWLRLRYSDSKDQVTEKEVMPLGLVQFGKRLYLIFRYEPTGTDRSLALHRMLKATPTTLGFERPRDFDLQRYADEGRHVYGDGSWVHLQFRITRPAGAHLRETPLWGRDHAIIDEGPTLLVSATVPDSLSLTRWLLSFGDELTVLRREKVQPPVEAKGAGS